MFQIQLSGPKTFRGHPVRLPKPPSKVAMAIEAHLYGDAEDAALRLRYKQPGGPPQPQVADVGRGRHARRFLQHAVQAAPAHAEEAEEFGHLQIRIAQMGDEEGI
jgi:hypothetical protein